MRLPALIAANLWLIPAAVAQCSMCRTAAAQVNGIDKAILVLLAPAVLLFSGVFLFAFHFRSGREVSGDDGDSEAL
jgi:hypothetical protein